MQNNPQELSWQAIQAIVGVKLSVELLRFDDIGFHLIKKSDRNAIDDSDIEIIEEESDGEHFSDINGNGRSGTSEDSAIVDPVESCHEDAEKYSDSGADVEMGDKQDTWACPNCNLRFFSKNDWQKHLETNQCDENDISADNNLSIDDYLEVTLSTDSDINFTCGKCQRTFTNEQELSAHTCLSPKPAEARKHSCHMCTEKFTSSWELRKHVNTHFPGMLDSKSSYCHICKKDYTKTGFMNHLRKHTGERPFVCELCHKAFSQSSSLSIHMKFHLNVRKHCCNVCEKKFVTKSELSRHMTVHTKQKSYYCGVCDKAFTRSDNMKKHEKTHG